MRLKGIFIVLVILIVIGQGCAKATDSESKKLVAKVNNYKMTIADFKNEAKSILPVKYAAIDAENAEEEILDAMILKQVLIQEAKRQNFDKDKAFMREIEKYWEQALLKLLYQRKTEELSRDIRVYDKEIMAEYTRLIDAGDINAAREPFEKISGELREDIRNRKIDAALDSWVENLESRASIKKYKENLKNIEVR